MTNLSEKNPATEASSWRNWEKYGFRFFFIFFALSVLPLSAAYWRNLGAIYWLHISYEDIFDITRYFPWISLAWSGYASLIIIAALALAGASGWALYDRSVCRRKTDLDKLHKWLRIILRYRLAIALLGYGLIKFFPLQAPYPSLSNLNTAYGDFTRWKLFSMSLGIVPGYQRFLGLIEMLSAFLLLNRKTTVIGAGIVIFFTGNVFVSNLAYDNGEGVYSLYLVIIALFLVSFDLGRIYSLLFQQKETLPADDALQWPPGWRANGRLAVKSVLILFFVIFYGAKTYSAYRLGDYYQLPQRKGLPGAAGVYTVSVFKWNGNDLPYAASDTLRWKDVIFENWATLSVGTSRHLVLDSTNKESVATGDLNRKYELSGSGGRQYYDYTVDSIHQALYLHNKNPHYPEDQWTLYYKRQGNKDWLLEGTDKRGNTVQVTLEKLARRYLLKEAAKTGRTELLRL